MALLDYGFLNMISSNYSIHTSYYPKEETKNKLSDFFPSSKNFLYKIGKLEATLVGNYSSIDIQKSIEKLYKNFTSLLESKNLQDKEYFSKNDIKKLAFVDENILKDLKENENLLNDKAIKAFDKNLYKTHTNNKAELDKQGLFLAYIFFNSNEYLGELNIRAKIKGLDKSVSADETNELKNFMKKNSITSFKSLELFSKAQELLSSNLNTKDFKQEWLKLKALNDELLKSEKQNLNSEEEKLNKENINTKPNTNSTPKEASKENSFTPIQAESKSETFTYDDIAKNFFLTFLENERKKGTDILELLQNLFKVDKNKVDLKV
ncbi:hypothetical protein [Campylobacter avium]|uniref:hypothetical protein n=1 Tax=Campylobacter avium TaxID=522485 RepID=UPI002356729F|nr:hypothetical protein [Campylobacter avium]